MRFLSFLAAYAALAAVCALALYRFTNLREYAALSRDGVATRGVIVGTDCRMQQSYRYTFQAEGHWFSGVAAGGTAQPCEALKPGDGIAVVYLPTDPTLNTSGDARQRRNSEALPGVAVTLLLPALALLRWRVSRRRRRLQR